MQRVNRVQNAAEIGRRFGCFQRFHGYGLSLAPAWSRSERGAQAWRGPGLRPLRFGGSGRGAAEERRRFGHIGSVPWRFFPMLGRLGGTGIVALDRGELGRTAVVPVTGQIDIVRIAEVVS
jgi:hypothetical protein